MPPRDGFLDLDNHPSTTDEIRALCQDLGVLGRVDFKLLLKWRLAVRKSAGLDKGKKKAPLRGGGQEDGGEAEADGDDDSDGGGGDGGDGAGDKGRAENEDERLMDEMTEVQQGLDARARRDKKKKAKLKVRWV